MSGALSNCNYSALGKDAVWVRLARQTERNAAALFVHIAHIIRLRANEQMRWIDATGIVALVKYAHVGRDIAMGKYVRKGVGLPDSSAPPIMELTVSMVVERSTPRPTLVRAALIHLLPKAHLWRTYITVPADIKHWFAPNVAEPFVVALGNACFLAAPALAVTVGYLFFGHKKPPVCNDRDACLGRKVANRRRIQLYQLKCIRSTTSALDTNIIPRNGMYCTSNSVVASLPKSD